MKTISLGGKGERKVVFTHNGLRLFRIDKTEIDRSALLTSFQYQNREFTVVNAHLSTDLHNTRKLKELAIITEAIPKDQPTLILGDFNYAVGRKGLDKAMGRHKFKSGLKKHKTFRFAPGISWQNDYIFQRDCQIKDISMNKVPYSDHYPVFFKIALPE
jgi:endonuclease/exonuclease/phosphatase family metal-dependent hydrolase